MDIEDDHESPSAARSTWLGGLIAVMIFVGLIWWIVNKDRQYTTSIPGYQASGIVSRPITPLH